MEKFSFSKRVACITKDVKFNCYRCTFNKRDVKTKMSWLGKMYI